MQNGDDYACEPRHEEDQSDQHASTQEPNDPPFMPYYPPHHNPGSGGLSDWRSPLSIRETLILILAVGSLVLSWSQVNSRLDMIQRDLAVQSSLQTTLRQDLTAAITEIRTHEQLPEHPIGAEHDDQIRTRLHELEGAIHELQGNGYKK